MPALASATADINPAPHYDLNASPCRDLYRTTTPAPGSAVASQAIISIGIRTTAGPTATSPLQWNQRCIAQRCTAPTPIDLIAIVVYIATAAAGTAVGSPAPTGFDRVGGILGASDPGTACPARCAVISVGIPARAPPGPRSSILRLGFDDPGQRNIFDHIKRDRTLTADFDRGRLRNIDETHTDDCKLRSIDLADHVEIDSLPHVARRTGLAICLVSLYRAVLGVYHHVLVTRQLQTRADGVMKIRCAVVGRLDPVAPVFAGVTPQRTLVRIADRLSVWGLTVAHRPIVCNAVVYCPIRAKTIGRTVSCAPIGCLAVGNHRAIRLCAIRGNGGVRFADTRKIDDATGAKTCRQHRKRRPPMI